jgi:hypothetical protein
VVPVGLLSVWFDLARELPERPDPPELATTWIELVPTGVPDVDDAAELAQWDEWSALAELLNEHAPARLDDLGFPEAQAAAIGAFIAGVDSKEISLLTSPRRGLVVQILRRLDRAAPWQSAGAAGLAATLGRPRPSLHGVSPPPRRALSPELRRILDAPPSAARAERELVERVLRDL